MMKCTKVLKCFESIKLPENGNQTTNTCYLSGNIITNTTTERAINRGTYGEIK